MNIAWFRRGFLVVVSFASLYASTRNLMSTRALGSTTDDPVADWEARFGPVKAQLPFQRGIIGYISDSDIPGVIFDAANDEGEYILSQYAIAPIILVRGTAQDWNLANLSGNAYQAWSASHRGDFEVFPFKGGLYLLHRVGQ
jgi:hypothetical protein